jgi:hypothetical protein
MSTDKRPGMAVNEEEIERHVHETKEQAKRAHYPRRPIPLHASLTEQGDAPEPTGAGASSDRSRDNNREGG